jgi:hypothetical protein
MGPPSYNRSIAGRNVVMRRMTVLLCISYAVHCSRQRVTSCLFLVWVNFIQLSERLVIGLTAEGCVEQTSA